MGFPVVRVLKGETQLFFNLLRVLCVSRVPSGRRLFLATRCSPLYRSRRFLTTKASWRWSSWEPPTEAGVTGGLSLEKTIECSPGGRSIGPRSRLANAWEILKVLSGLLSTATLRIPSPRKVLDVKVGWRVMGCFVLMWMFACPLL